MSQKEPNRAALQRVQIRSSCRHACRSSIHPTSEDDDLKSITCKSLCHIACTRTTSFSSNICSSTKIRPTRATTGMLRSISQCALESTYGHGQTAFLRTMAACFLTLAIEIAVSENQLNSMNFHTFCKQTLSPFRFALKILLLPCVNDKQLGFILLLGFVHSLVGHLFHEQLRCPKGSTRQQAYLRAKTRKPRHC